MGWRININRVCKSGETAQIWHLETRVPASSHGINVSDKIHIYIYTRLRTLDTFLDESIVSNDVSMLEQLFYSPIFFRHFKIIPSNESFKITFERRSKKIFNKFQNDFFSMLKVSKKKRNYLLNLSSKTSAIFLDFLSTRIFFRILSFIEDIIFMGASDTYKMYRSFLIFTMSPIFLTLIKIYIYKTAKRFDIRRRYSYEKIVMFNSLSAEDSRANKSRGEEGN